MGLTHIKFEHTVDMVSYCMINGTSDKLTGEAMRASEERV